jgi:hypothetical protein
MTDSGSISFVFCMGPETLPGKQNLISSKFNQMNPHDKH